MQTTVTEINSYSKKLTVELTPQELQKLERKIIRRYQKKADIPGFRPGKAPESLIRKRYQELILQDLIDEALQTYYGKAIEESGLEPVAQGKITDLKFEDVEKGLIFVVELEVEPEIELKKYKGLKVEKDVMQATDENVNHALEDIRERFATVKEVEEAKEGHVVHFEAQELDEGNVPIVGHKYENLSAELGSGKFDLEIEKQLIGIKTGEKRIVTKEIPATEEQPAQVTRLEIEAKKIEEKELPELDDEFVKNLPESDMETLEQLKERLRQNIQREFDRQIEETLNQRIIDELLKENPFDVPPSMVENYLNEMVNDLKRQASDQPIDEEAVRSNYRAAAIHHIRWYFLKKKIAEVENIQVTDEEVKKLIDESQGIEEKFKEHLKNDRSYLNRLKDDLLEKRILDFLKENAEIVETFPGAKQAVKKATARKKSGGSKTGKRKTEKKSKTRPKKEDKKEE